MDFMYNFGGLIDSCVVSTGIFVLGRNLRSGYQSVGVLWNWVSVPGVFAELARDFSRLKGVLLASHVTASS